MHTFGFGSGVDWYLVKELAKQGKGTYAILQDTSSLNVNTNVIRALKIATNPAYTNLKTAWTLDVAHEVPWAPFIETYFANELFILTALIKKSQVDSNSSVNIDLFETLTSKRNQTSISLSSATRVVSDELFKICAKREIEHLYLEEKRDSAIKSMIVQMSTHYGVLTKHTAIFGVCKNKDKSAEEPVTVECRVKPYKDLAKAHQSPFDLYDEEIFLCRSAAPSRLDGKSLP